MSIRFLVYKIYFILLLFFVFTIIFVISLKIDSYDLNKKIIEKLELTWLGFFERSHDFNYDRRFVIDNIIAHAGGGINGLSYTNSLEALEQSYRQGFKFVEVDLQWTADNQLVLIHDWHQSVERLFSRKPITMSLQEFKEQRMVDNLTPLTFDDFLVWLKDKPDLYIITDTGALNNIKVLAEIKQKLDGQTKNFIPQIYNFTQYYKARQLGFDKIILSLYKRGYTNESLVFFIDRYPISAIAVPASQAQNILAASSISVKTPVYAYPVNNITEARKLKGMGLEGIYTDFLTPDIYE